MKRFGWFIAIFMMGSFFLVAEESSEPTKNVEEPKTEAVPSEVPVSPPESSSEDTSTSTAEVESKSNASSESATAETAQNSSTSFDESCEKDVEKNCSDLPEGKTKFGCLRENRDKLSESCKAKVNHKLRKRKAAFGG